MSSMYSRVVFGCMSMILGEESKSSYTAILAMVSTWLKTLVSHSRWVVSSFPCWELVCSDISSMFSIDVQKYEASTLNFYEISQKSFL